MKRGIFAMAVLLGIGLVALNNSERESTRFAKDEYPPPTIFLT